MMLGFFFTATEGGFPPLLFFCFFDLLLGSTSSEGSSCVGATGGIVPGGGAGVGDAVGSGMGATGEGATGAPMGEGGDAGGAGAEGATGGGDAGPANGELVTFNLGPPAVGLKAGAPGTLSLRAGGGVGGVPGCVMSKKVQEVRKKCFWQLSQTIHQVKHLQGLFL